MRLLLSIASLAVVSGGHQVVAQDATHYEGQKVVVVQQGAEARKGNRVVRNLNLGDIYKISRVAGQRLLIDQPVGGWIDASNVVPHDRARDHFDHLVRQEPSAHNHHSRGLALLAMGEADAAIEDFTRAMQLDPTDVAHLHDRARAWERKGDLDKAIAD